MAEKRAYLIHGWGGTSTNGFKPWLKKELEKHGYDVYVPTCPSTGRPTTESWIPFLLKEIPDPDEHTILVGHSLGCKALLLYLQELPQGSRVHTLACVAGVFGDITGFGEEELRLFQPWKEAAIDYEKIRHMAERIIAFFDDNDPYIPLESSSQIAKEKLGAEIIIEHDKNHYISEEGTLEVPRVLEAILRP